MGILSSLVGPSKRDLDNKFELAIKNPTPGRLKKLKKIAKEYKDLYGEDATYRSFEKDIERLLMKESSFMRASKASSTKSERALKSLEKCVRTNVAKCIAAGCSTKDIRATLKIK